MVMKHQARMKFPINSGYLWLCWLKVLYSEPVVRRHYKVIEKHHSEFHEIYGASHLSRKNFSKLRNGVSNHSII